MSARYQTLYAVLWPTGKSPEVVHCWASRAALGTEGTEGAMSDWTLHGCPQDWRAAWNYQDSVPYTEAFYSPEEALRMTHQDEARELGATKILMANTQWRVEQLSSLIGEQEDA